MLCALLYIKTVVTHHLAPFHLGDMRVSATESSTFTHITELWRLHMIYPHQDLINAPQRFRFFPFYDEFYRPRTS